MSISPVVLGIPYLRDRGEGGRMRTAGEDDRWARSRLGPTGCASRRLTGHLTVATLTLGRWRSVKKGPLYNARR
ncbi:hypothetical protein Vqi01_07970 [Micromonospora qiuiae]|uniref:Uncharacterized protein n=1 Tax=Micromonospora qiuiae TaxID=502268 RepID=A0ABQ4J634_9ACTN|nr:hypothetical protein Vqi01_07970 [Micromonospora qiuiae]